MTHPILGMIENLMQMITPRLIATNDHTPLKGTSLKLAPKNVSLLLTYLFLQKAKDAIIYLKNQIAFIYKVI